MKYIKVRYLFFFLLLTFIASCTAYKKVPYLQMDDPLVDDIDLFTMYHENAIRFQPDDVLFITVNVAGEPAIADDYNLPLQPTANMGNEAYVATGMGRQSYRVNKDGEVDFPILGLIKVKGFTQEELEARLKLLIMEKGMKVEPVVTVNLVNFKIFVLGEVNRPGLHTISNTNHLNLFQALSIAGDLSIYGKREDVRLLRRMPNGDIKMITLDITRADVVSSPYFYLHQDDQIYVIPNKSRTQLVDISPHLNIIIGISSFLMSFTTFMLYLLNR